MSLDWLLDSQQYNEWLNEEDYQLDENGKVKVGTNMAKQPLVVTLGLSFTLHITPIQAVIVNGNKVNFVFVF